MVHFNTKQNLKVFCVAIHSKYAPLLEKFLTTNSPEPASDDQISGCWLLLFSGLASVLIILGCEFLFKKTYGHVRAVFKASICAWSKSEGNQLGTRQPAVTPMTIKSRLVQLKQITINLEITSKCSLENSN